MCVRVSSKDLLYLIHVGSTLNEIHQESFIDTKCFSCLKWKVRNCHSITLSMSLSLFGNGKLLICQLTTKTCSNCEVSVFTICPVHSNKETFEEELLVYKRFSYNIIFLPLVIWAHFSWTKINIPWSDSNYPFIGYQSYKIFNFQNIKFMKSFKYV